MGGKPVNYFKKVITMAGHKRTVTFNDKAVEIYDKWKDHGEKNTKVSEAVIRMNKADEIQKTEFLVDRMMVLNLELFDLKGRVEELERKCK
jgi:hypothetical protein